MKHDDYYMCSIHGATRHQWCRTCEVVTARRRAYGREVSPMVHGEHNLQFGRKETSDLPEPTKVPF